jgi:hypothetical protein
MSDMPNQEFVSNIRESLKQQREKSATATREKLHRAEVIQTEGPRVWDELRNEVSANVAEINRNIPEPSLEDSSDERKITIQYSGANRVAVAEFDSKTASINYSGSSISGTFIASVLGDGLSYSDRNTVPTNEPVESPVLITIAQIAEKLLETVVMP